MTTDAPGAAATPVCAAALAPIAERQIPFHGDEIAAALVSGDADEPVIMVPVRPLYYRGAGACLLTPGCRPHDDHPGESRGPADKDPGPPRWRDVSRVAEHFWDVVRAWQACKLSVSVRWAPAFAGVDSGEADRPIRASGNTFAPDSVTGWGWTWRPSASASCVTRSCLTGRLPWFLHPRRVAGDGPSSAALLADMLHNWLFGVSAQRVRPEYREALNTYRRECFAVLWRAYQAGELGAPGPRPEIVPTGAPAALAQVRATALVVAAMAEQQMALETRVTTTEDRLDRAAHVVADLSRRVTAIETGATPAAITEAQAAEVSQAVKAVAQLMAEGQPDARGCGPNPSGRPSWRYPPKDHPGECRGPAGNTPLPPKIRRFGVSGGWAPAFAGVVLGELKVCDRGLPAVSCETTPGRTWVTPDAGNPYVAVFGERYGRFGVTSYRSFPAARFADASYLAPNSSFSPGVEAR